MSDEASKLRNANRERSPHRVEIKRRKADGEANLLARFFRKVSQLFMNEVEIQEAKLGGRINELQATAHVMHKQLVVVKDSIKANSDQKTYTLACGLIDPIIKEISRLQNDMEHKSTVTQQVKTVSKYVEWIEKARSWLELEEDSNTERIQQIIIFQTTQEFQARIARDIQVIQDYLSHATDILPVSDKLKGELRKKVLPTLSPILVQLYALQKIPKDMALDDLTAWRAASDREREGHFSEALHTIDSFFMEFTPPQTESKPSDH